jgi:protein-S-isoprenylcysteine O-methyltransferase Ste14
LSSGGTRLPSGGRRLERDVTPDRTIYALWLAWVISWFIAARWANATVNRPGFSREMLYRVVQGIGVLFLFGGLPPGARFAAPDWAAPLAIRWAMVGVAMAGFVFCWWARLHLGRLWSGTVTRKADHHVVDTGPYAIVRHPIYTGIIAAAFATAIARGTNGALLGAALIVVGFWIKARLEERFLRTELGAEAYNSYARRTAMLVPFVRL